MKKLAFLCSLATFAVSACVSSMGHASIVVTQNNNALALANAVTASGGAGLTVTSAVLLGHSSNGAMSSGTYSANGATYGLAGSGIVLNTGNVSDYNSGPNTSNSNSTSFGANATAAQSALLGTISGAASYFDVTELVITFDMQAGFDTAFFNVVFGSEEYPEFVGTGFIDSFGLFVNGTNIAFANGDPINVDHPDFDAIAGTELDGVIAPGGNPVMTFSAFVGLNSTDNELRFIIADRGDGIYDSTAYIGALGGTNPAIPEPGSFMVWGVLALAGVGMTNRRRKS